MLIIFTLSNTRKRKPYEIKNTRCRSIHTSVSVLPNGFYGKLFIFSSEFGGHKRRSTQTTTVNENHTKINCVLNECKKIVAFFPTCYCVFRRNLSTTIATAMSLLRDRTAGRPVKKKKERTTAKVYGLHV